MIANTITYRKDFLSDQAFKRLSDIIRTYSGISLNSAKKELVKNRLRKRLKALEINSFLDYCNLLDSRNGANEIPHLIDAISTNVTSFFRERPHYRFLYEHALPIVRDTLTKKDGEIKIWSAACSSGEEPYSISMVAEAFFELKMHNIKILATDICSRALKVAETGIYSEKKIKSIPKYFWRYFKPHTNGYLKIDSRISEKVHFKRFNLIKDIYPFSNKFDIIFCRNVLIYFDYLTQRKLIDKLKKFLKPGGYLFLGHAESLYNKSKDSEYVAPSIYRKRKAS